MTKNKVLVIGKQNCSRCDMTKNILHKKEIEFEYVSMEDLSKEDRIKYKKMNMSAGIMEFPIIIVDNEAVSLQEVL